jgi:predicted HAD superfamily Cof-like phosphohydrolase
MSQLTNFQKVNAFNVAFGIGRSSTPDDKLFKLRWDLIQEESEELYDAINRNDYVEILDAVSDILYVVHGAADSFEQDFDKCLIEHDVIKLNIKQELSDIPFGVKRMEAVFQLESETLKSLTCDYSKSVDSLKSTFETKDISQIITKLAVVHNYLYQWADLFGFDLDYTFNMVHDSNMSKLAETEEIAQKTVKWYLENEKRYDSPAYRLSTVKVNDMDRWVIYNANSGKALKSINYHAVDFAPLFTEIA